MYHDSEFKHALWFTLLLVVVIVPIQFVIAFVMALIVNAKLKGRGLLLFIFILPLAVSDLAAGLVWQQIFTDHGYLNTILEHLGIIDQPKIWIDPSHSNWLLGEVVLTEMWRSTAFIMIILVAGLQGIPKEFGEAAEVFGASFFQRVRNVTLPMLKPALQVALLFRIIFAFEVFASVIAITGRREDDARGRVAALAGRVPRPARRLGVRPADPRALARRGRHRGEGPADAEGEAAAMSSVGLTEPQHARRCRPRAAVSQQAAHPARAGRVLLYVLAIAMALWVILPIYFITLGAFSTQDAVYAYPRELLPRHLSTDTLSFFLHSTGHHRRARCAACRSR